MVNMRQLKNDAKQVLADFKAGRHHDAWDLIANRPAGPCSEDRHPQEIAIIVALVTAELKDPQSFIDWLASA